MCEREPLVEEQYDIDEDALHIKAEEEDDYHDFWKSGDEFYCKVKKRGVSKVYIIFGFLLLLILLAGPMYISQSVNMLTGVTTQKMYSLFFYIEQISPLATTMIHPLYEFASSAIFTYYVSFYAIIIGCILLIVGGIVTKFVKNKIVNIALPLAGIILLFFATLNLGTMTSKESTAPAPSASAYSFRYAVVPPSIANVMLSSVPSAGVLLTLMSISVTAPLSAVTSIVPTSGLALNT